MLRYVAFAPWQMRLAEKAVQNSNEPNKGRILIVDDEFHVARAAASVLSQAGYECETYPTVEAALLALDQNGADVIVADMRMPGMDGMDLLKKVHVKEPDLAVVLTAPGPPAESAKAALRGGAFDYVTKPFDTDELNGEYDEKPSWPISCHSWTQAS